MNKNRFTFTLSSMFSLAEDFSVPDLQVPGCFWYRLRSAIHQGHMDTMNTFKCAYRSQKCPGRRKPGFPAGIMGAGLEAAQNLCRHRQELPEQWEQFQLLFGDRPPVSTGKTQWDSVAFLPSCQLSLLLSECLPLTASPLVIFCFQSVTWEIRWPELLELCVNGEPSAER